MTRPSEIKPREGEQRGTTYDDYVIGDTLPPLHFSVTPEIMQEYAGVVDGDAAGYEVDGRRAALPSVLQVYFMAVLYSKYPPQQGGVMGSNQFRFFEPIWADESIDIVGTGRIEKKFVKRDKRYVSFSADFKDKNGRMIAQALNVSHFPE
ncbi:hypothetical protein PIGHUM_00821 [Pigmentiphaga humi]|uniref:N-terminal of MaoC-like dehydratase domain-containing protein n=1 Tax=Pigmentiphaga humi TaxID=2478468 RepID=A0A3P4AXH7_9BURK|nr:hypothetical protein [Pigmentiphaga humi]VCU68763.1 hypothetical protein PIGHUM_00821 [Pigmentiphaga humi]